MFVLLELALVLVLLPLITVLILPAEMLAVLLGYLHKGWALAAAWLGFLSIYLGHQSVPVDAQIVSTLTLYLTTPIAGVQPFVWTLGAAAICGALAFVLRPKL